ncbi:hypothetical protein QR680_010961 [Steinernema hermaphroditum]|nr:hypothetical protein QR680_010961 [Steinernema hermaphroditum]
MASFLQLESNEGHIFHFPTSFAVHSSLLQQMLSDLGFESPEDATKVVIPLISLDSSTLKHLGEWIKLVNLEEPISEEQLLQNRYSVGIPREEEDLFESLDRADLSKLIVAAYFFECGLLTENLIKYVHSRLEGLSSERMTQWLGLEDDKKRPMTEENEGGDLKRRRA